MDPWDRHGKETYEEWQHLKAFIAAAVVGVLFLALIAWCNPAHAAELPQPTNPITYRLNMGEAWGVGWATSGANQSATAMMPATIMSIMAAYKFAPGWSASADLMAYVPHDKFRPCPRLTIGVGYRWANRLGLGLSAMEQVNPAYTTGSHLANVVGATLAPSIALTDVIGFSFGIGYRAVIESGRVIKHALALGPSFSFLLPF